MTMQGNLKIITREELPVLAADVGGSKIMTAIFSGTGEMKSKRITPTAADEGVGAVIERLSGAVSRHLEENDLKPAELTGISIAVAGGVDIQKGVVVTSSPNLTGWYDVPLREEIQGRFGVPVTVLNDASAAALGEQRFGAGEGKRNLVLLTLGTGIGGGIIIEGMLYQGASGGAGELGHMTVDESGPACGCGNTGCLEMYASGRAIAREAVKRIKSGEKSVLTGNITAEEVAAAAENGDSLAREVIARVGHYLGVGLVSIVNIFNPEMIVIGGGMAETGEILLGPARDLVRERAYGISAGVVEIVTAKLGNEAGVYGAAAYARENIIRRTA
jgi:glucokinase